MHCRPDLTQFPDIENYMETARRQLGVNILNIISYGKAPSEKNLPRAEYLKQAVRFYADSYLRQLDFCLKNRFYGTPSLHMGSSLRPRGKIDFDLIRGVVKQIRNHPALLCYKYDEPEVRKVVTPEDIRTMYRIIKEEDPVHPVSINLCDRGRFHEFLPGSDIASYDHYPFPHSDLNAWRLYTTDILRLKPDAPFFTMLQTFQFPNTEPPSQEEIYASFITSMIDGARSLTCYSWFEFNNCTSLVKSPDMQAVARLMAAHYEQLCRYLFQAREQPLKLDASKDILWKYYRDRKTGCLLAVNLSQKRTAKIRLELPGDKNITDFFDPAWTFQRGSIPELAPGETLVLKHEL